MVIEKGNNCPEWIQRFGMLFIEKFKYLMFQVDYVYEDVILWI